MKINNFAVRLIEKYQKNKPPKYQGRCIHYPSCSSYSKECYQKFNFFKASFLTFKRILFCTPLNKKTYDPVPLTKEEKKQEKELYNKALEIEPILLEHYHKYPLMKIEDFLKLIYQNSFGPSHLLNDNYQEMIKKEIDETDNEIEYIEDIGNGYIRLYLGKNSDVKYISKLFKDSINTDINDEYPLFYKKILVFQNLIRKKKIRIKRKVANIKIREFLYNPRPIHHSDIYRDIYKPHYRLIKKCYLD